MFKSIRNKIGELSFKLYSSIKQKQEEEAFSSLKERFEKVLNLAKTPDARKNLDPVIVQQINRNKEEVKKQLDEMAANIAKISIEDARDNLTVLIIGLAGSGKSTLTETIALALKGQGVKSIRIDDDEPNSLNNFDKRIELLKDKNIVIKTVQQNRAVSGVYLDGDRKRQFTIPVQYIGADL